MAEVVKVTDDLLRHLYGNDDHRMVHGSQAPQANGTLSIQPTEMEITMLT